MPENDTKQIEGVDCPACARVGQDILNGVKHTTVLPERVVWCPLCCSCDEAGALGDLNIYPMSLTELWHAIRGNRVGYVEAGVDVRHALRPPGFVDWMQANAEEVARQMEVPQGLMASAGPGGITITMVPQKAGFPVSVDEDDE